jgi:hypothetical protein
MTRKSPPFTFEQIPGDLYPDLATAQRHALKATAADLAVSLRSLLAARMLVQRNGRITINPDRV